MYVHNNNNTNNATYFDSFGVEHIPKEIKAFINNNDNNNNNNNNIVKNIFRIQAHGSIMCRYFCIGFIDLLDLLSIKACRKNFN